MYLPAPAHQWEPNHWFDQISESHYHIDGGVAQKDDRTHPVVIGVVHPLQMVETLGWYKNGLKHVAERLCSRVLTRFYTSQ